MFQPEPALHHVCLKHAYMECQYKNGYYKNDVRNVHSLNTAGLQHEFASFRGQGGICPPFGISTLQHTSPKMSFEVLLPPPPPWRFS